MNGLGNFRDVFKTIKHKKPTPIFCPRCGSPEIKLSSSLDYWLTPRKYFCPKCGYIGILVMELEEDQNSQGTEEKQTENENASEDAKNENNKENQNETKSETEN